MEDFKSQLGHTAARLRTAAEVTSAITGLKSMAQGMVTRADRLEQNLFTVALFGAFSAGKSSFANALMGEMVLPVSPNPTTAAINKILPPTTDYPHGSVRVKIKSAQDITADVQQSLAVFGLSASSLAEAELEIAKLNPADVLSTAKPHFTFLKAVSKGLAPIQDHLGQELLVDLKEFKAFVAKEEKACFAEWIELYYDCPLTQQGITLVDTPGADSINARHTGVAFNYIKNADAVLFVTYYNHAFSNADRDFLTQLGRVKDTFEMDKMFFIVNAADLAKDEEELRGVVDHVRKNLVACQISMPRIYPVSSQTALLARLHEKGMLNSSAEKVYRQRTNSGEGELMPAGEALTLSGLRAFEKDFLSFTIQELTGIAVKSALTEIRRAVGTLDDLITSATESESVRATKLQAAGASKQGALDGLQAVETSAEERAVEKEIEELLYYVKQRLFFRFGDMFKEAFNPAVLQDDGRDLKKALRQSLDELVRYIGYTLGQEMRATGLRIEKHVNHSAKRLADRMADAVQQAASTLELTAYLAQSFEAPEFAEALPSHRVEEYAATLGLFKSAKDFFEKNGKQAMQEALDKQLQTPVSAYLDDASQKFKQTYGTALLTAVQDRKQQASAEVEEYFAGILEALSAQVDVEKLTEARAHLQNLLDA